MMNKELDINPIIARKRFCPPSTAALRLSFIPVRCGLTIRLPPEHPCYISGEQTAGQASQADVPRITVNSTQSGAESGT